MKYARELLIVLLVAAILRFGPLLLYGVPLSYDTPFHMARAQEIVDSGFLNRSEHYPPFYRLLMAELAQATGLGVPLLGMWLLPFFSVLTVLSVFVFVRRLMGSRMALLSALLVAAGSPLIAAAYDSPENIVFFLLPLMFLLYRQNHRWLAAGLAASFVLWNQLAALVIWVSLVAAHWKDLDFLKRLAAMVVAAGALYLATIEPQNLFNQSLTNGMDFIAYNLRDAMPVIAGICLLFGLPLLVACHLKRATGGWVRFWFIWFGLSLAGLASFVTGWWLRPWEDLKFLYLAGAVLAGLVRGGKKMRWFLYGLVAFMVFSSIVMSFQLVYPKLQAPDFKAIDFLEVRARSDAGGIVAEPSLGQWIAFRRPSLANRVLTSLHFEAAGGRNGFGAALNFLRAPSAETAAPLHALQGLRAKYVVVNYEDAALRDVKAIEAVPNLNKVYSVEYFTGCPFPFLPQLWGISCGWNEAEVLEWGAEKG